MHITGVKSRETGRARVNHLIKVPEVRLIDSEGNQVGVVSLQSALSAAENSQLDLVEISPNADPPVCRIMDYGKYRFEQSKKLAQAKKNQKKFLVKEVKFRPATEEGDYQVKLRNLTRFLESGDKAKVTIRFRGREIAYQNAGMELLQRIEKDLEGIAVVEQQPKREGRQLTMVIAPKKT